jgi:hypothetical protein
VNKQGGSNWLIRLRNQFISDRLLVGTRTSASDPIINLPEPALLIFDGL